MVRFHVPGEDPARPSLHAHFDLAARVAKEVSSMFKAPHELELEKIYSVFLLFQRKRYVALKHESPDDPGTQDVKGIALVRREHAPLTKKVLQDVLKVMLWDRDPPEALAVARRHVLRVLDDANPMDDYVMSKTLRTGYKSAAQPHVTVARKTHERRGTPVPSGTRVRYVYVEDLKNPDGKSSDRAEDPDFALENDMTVDRLYYIKNQLWNPLVDMFKPVVEKPADEIFGHPDVAPRLAGLEAGFRKDVKTAKRVRKNEANRQPEITSFFTKIST